MRRRLGEPDHQWSPDFYGGMGISRESSEVGGLDLLEFHLSILSQLFHAFAGE